MRVNENICACCREVKQPTYFYPSFGVQSKNKVLGICKDCCSEKLIKYSAIVGEEAGAWVLMGELGLPFIRSIWKQAQEDCKKSRSKIGEDPLYVYIKLLKDSGTIYQGFWESDTTFEELTGKNKNKNKNHLDLELMHNRWGVLDDVSAYEFLENTFLEYTEGLFNIDTNLEKRYKDLCMAEYQKRKAQESGDPDRIAKAQKNVNDMLKLLKLDDFQKASTDDRDRFIDRLIWKIEETEPAEEEDEEKYKDIAGYEKIYNSFMRSMRNILSGQKEYPKIPKEAE